MILFKLFLRIRKIMFKYSIVFAKKKILLTNEVIKFFHFLLFFKIFFNFCSSFLLIEIISFDATTFEFV